jgi:hypothetical protein
MQSSQYSNYFPVTCTRAAVRGDLATLVQLHDQGQPWSVQTCRSAVLGGHEHCLRFAHENGCPVNGAVSDAAAFGQLDCLIYLHEHGCPWGARVCETAAMGGFTDCLRYAMEHGCPWTKSTCTTAALNGQLECLVYAIEQGCPWDEYTYNAALRNGHIDCAEYINWRVQSKYTEAMSDTSPPASSHSESMVR